MQDPGDIDVDSSTVPEGSEFEVGYKGKHTLQYSVDFSGEWKEVPLDPKTGKGKITAPIGAQFIFLSDGDLSTPGITIEVFSSSTPCPPPARKDYPWRSLL